MYTLKRIEGYLTFIGFLTFNEHLFNVKILAVKSAKLLLLNCMFNFSQISIVQVQYNPRRHNILNQKFSSPCGQAVKSVFLNHSIISPLCLVLV